MPLPAEGEPDFTINISNLYVIIVLCFIRDSVCARIDFFLRSFFSSTILDLEKVPHDRHDMELASTKETSLWQGKIMQVPFSIDDIISGSNSSTHWPLLRFDLDEDPDGLNDNICEGNTIEVKTGAEKITDSPFYDHTNISDLSESGDNPDDCFFEVSDNITNIRSRCQDDCLNLFSRPKLFDLPIQSERALHKFQMGLVNTLVALRSAKSTESLRHHRAVQKEL